MTRRAPAGAAEGPTVLQPAGWPAPRGYANGMMAEGRLLVTGGVVGWDEQERFPDGFVPQVRQALLNIRAILAEGGAEPRHLVRLTWYVVDIEEYLGSLRDLGAAYREVLGRITPPWRWSRWCAWSRSGRGSRSRPRRSSLRRPKQDQPAILRFASSSVASMPEA